MFRRLFAPIAIIITMGLHPASAAEGAACPVLAAAVDMNQAEPLFLASFPTVEPGPLKDVAFLYDNAVAVIALVGCGEVDKAKRIGDAILAALAGDRHWRDGRLRNGYLAGVVAETPVKLPGWWNPDENKWVEDGYQAGSDTGNMAWAMLALLTLHEQAHELRYRDGAEQIARYVEHSLSGVSPVGFDGGTFGFEPAPVHNTWKSTEHNTDLAAAFGRLAAATGDAHWAERSSEAEAFVAAMWQADCRCFAAGTGEDGQTPNMVLALDAQIWPLLAIKGGEKRFPGVLETADLKLRYGDGYAYGEAKDGVWTEGTAQAGLLMALEGKADVAAGLMAAVNRNRSPDGWYYAADTEALPTGFNLQTDPSKPRLYLHLPHLAALGWVALFERRFNPFTGTTSLPGPKAP